MAFRVRLGNIRKMANLMLMNQPRAHPQSGSMKMAFSGPAASTLAELEGKS